MGSGYSLCIRCAQHKERVHNHSAQHHSYLRWIKPSPQRCPHAPRPGPCLSRLSLSQARHLLYALPASLCVPGVEAGSSHAGECPGARPRRPGSGDVCRDAPVLPVQRSGLAARGARPAPRAARTGNAPFPPQLRKGPRDYQGARQHEACWERPRRLLLHGDASLGSVWRVVSFISSRPPSAGCQGRSEDTSNLPPNLAGVPGT